MSMKLLRLPVLLLVVFTTMCGVHSGVNLCLKDDFIKGDCNSPKTKIFPELLHYSPVVLNDLSASTNIL